MYFGKCPFDLLHWFAVYIYCVKLKKNFLQNKVHLIYVTYCEISTNSNAPHYKMKCNATLFVSCGLPFANHTLNGMPTLRVAKPKLLCEQWAHKGVRCLFINHQWDILSIYLCLDVQRSWLWLKASSFGHKATTLHLVCGNHIICLGTTRPHSNIQWAAQTSFVLVQKTIFFVSNMGGFPLWVPSLLEIVHSACLLRWCDCPNFLRSLFLQHYNNPTIQANYAPTLGQRL